MSKKESRKNMIHTLSELDEDYKQEKENILKEELLNYIKVNNFTSVGIVLSMPHEMDTDGIISTLLEDGIKVYNPVVDYKAKVMNFYPFTNMEDILKDKKGIRIPPTTVKTNDFEVVVVPGLVFNEQGYRIGYGGGYYDKFLADFEGQKVSVIFDEQFGTVEHESHDIPVDYIITPTRKLDAEAGR